MTNKKFTLRQGDVLIMRVDAMPAEASKQEKREPRGLILAHGEVTGHAHRIPQSHASIYRTETDARYLRVTAPVGLRHEEHKTVCHACPQEPGVIATTYAPGPEVTMSSYTCDVHRHINSVQLKAPGDTIILPGDYLISIHAEYVPGELPRQVED